MVERGGRGGGEDEEVEDPSSGNRSGAGSVTAPSHFATGLMAAPSEAPAGGGVPAGVIFGRGRALRREATTVVSEPVPDPGASASGSPEPEIVTRDAAMLRIVDTLARVAHSRAPVLIEGERGTGKELLARHLHASSPRRGAAFVVVDCAAAPPELLERELLGRERGAFAGAIARTPGKLELADGGTLLLDEVGELDARLQATLLRVLQDGEVVRVGGSAAVPVDVRIVATSSRPLSELVARGAFRQDLFYRLAVVPLVVPPLRARRDDVALLAARFVERFRGERAVRLSATAVDVLAARPWPGNVRELEHVLERAVLLGRGPAIEPPDLDSDAGSLPVPPRGSLAGFTVREIERRLILDTLERTHDNRTQAARLLGISIRTLRNKLTEYRRSGELPTRLATPRGAEAAR